MKARPRIPTPDSLDNALGDVESLHTLFVFPRLSVEDDDDTISVLLSLSPYELQMPISLFAPSTIIRMLSHPVPVAPLHALVPSISVSLHMDSAVD